MSGRFDPRPYLRRLDNGELYLDVKWRLHWLRSEHPGAAIETELISAGDDAVVCKARVALPEGGSATGHASVSRSGDGSHIERAETRAIGRALAALGYGTEFADPDAFIERGAREEPAGAGVALVPPAEPSPTERPARPEPPREPPRPRPVRPVEPDAAEPADRGPRDIRDAREAREAREVREEHGRPAYVSTGAPDDDTPEEPVAIPPMMRGSDVRPRAEAPRERVSEDVLWPKFWEWANRRGYRDVAHLKELMGIDANALTPYEVRDHIKRYELDHDPPAMQEQEP